MTDDPVVTAAGRPSLRDLLGNARVQFWMCPVAGHGEGPPLRETVRWIGDVAHCMEPGCGRTSADPKEQDQSE